MSAQSATRQEAETPEMVLRRLRESTQRWLQQERLRPRLSSGLVGLDECLGGGWPLGKVAELVGPRSCGRTTAALATVAAATGRGEVVAWIDLPDTLDPPSLAAVGVDLERVLWVRPATREQAVRATELVLEAGGFTVVVLDLLPARAGDRGQGTGDGKGRAWGSGAITGVRELPSGLGSGVRGPGSGREGDSRLSALDSRPGGCSRVGGLSRVGGGGDPSTLDLRPSTGWVEDSRLSTLDSRPGGRGKGALALRLARAVERAGVAALVLAERPWAGSLAGVTVWLERSGAQWLGGERGGPRWLAGLSPRPSLQPPALPVARGPWSVARPPTHRMDRKSGDRAEGSLRAPSTEHRPLPSPDPGPRPPDPNPSDSLSTPSAVPDTDPQALALALRVGGLEGACG
ncbi:MAG: DNA recombination/repair protein RecA [Thermoanaerobaculaceae bacterium]|nr:DNA recombination/repair protein RecA [Thermoanaerobaculaceae bacterium]